MAQLELAGTLEPQVVVSTKSPKLFPTIPMPRMLNGVLPVLVNVTVCGGLMVPTLWSGKSRLVGDNLTTVPVPVSAITCGLLAASSVMVTVPVLTPLSLGLKATRIVQLSPAGKLDPQLS